MKREKLARENVAKKVTPRMQTLTIAYQPLYEPPANSQ